MRQKRALPIAALAAIAAALAVAPLASTTSSKAHGAKQRRAKRGPRGKQGPPGPRGPQGSVRLTYVTGATGANPASGTARVVASALCPAGTRVVGGGGVTSDGAGGTFTGSGQQMDTSAPVDGPDAGGVASELPPARAGHPDRWTSR